MDIDAETALPVWITIDVPSDAVAGKYSANLELFTNNKKRETFTFNLNIINKTLPLTQSGFPFVAKPILLHGRRC